MSLDKNSQHAIPNESIRININGIIHVIESFIKIK